MKVVAFNGSPKKEGNTYQALRCAAAELEQQGIEVEIIHVGNSDIHPCKHCNACYKLKNNTCVQADDQVNEWIAKMVEADGVLLGSPVHYAGISGAMKTFLDRAFYVVSIKGDLRLKVGAALVTVRRAGGIPALDALHHYLAYTEMIVPTANYWSALYGMTPGEVTADAEGMQCARLIGKNMGWLMKVIEAGKKEVPAPEKERKTMTSFVRKDLTQA